MDQSVANAGQMVEGSPIDRLFFQVLLGAAILVLIRRGRRTTSALKANWAILLYFSFCLLSILWSDFPDVSFSAGSNR